MIRKQLLYPSRHASNLRRGGEDLANGRLLTARDELALASHEVSVTANGVVAVHPGHDGLEERRDLIVRAGGGELADEDLLARGGVGSVADVLLEVLGVLGAVVPVNVDAVNGAIRARLEEGREPAKTHGTATVGDGGSAELGLASERLHVLLVSGGGLGGAQVGLRGKVGLVEGEEVGGARVNGALGVAGPGVGELRSRAPKSGDVLDGVGEAGAGRAPVVAPGDLRARDKAVGQLGIVVSNTTLAGLAGRRAGSGRRSSAGRAGRAIADVDANVALVGSRVSHSRGGSGGALLNGGNVGAGGSGRRVSGRGNIRCLGHGLSLGAVGGGSLRVGRSGRLNGRLNRSSLGRGGGRVGRGRRLNRRLSGSGLGRARAGNLNGRGSAGGHSDGLLDSGGDCDIASASRGRTSVGGGNRSGGLVLRNDVRNNDSLAGRSNGSASCEASTSRVNTSTVGAGVRVGREARGLVVVELRVTVTVALVGDGKGSGGEGQDAQGVDGSHFDNVVW
jgi:hypothetical protein